MCMAVSVFNHSQDHLDEPGACFARTAGGGLLVELRKGEAVTEWCHEEASEDLGGLTFTEWRETPLKKADGKSSGRHAVAAKGILRGGGRVIESGRPTPAP